MEHVVSLGPEVQQFLYVRPVGARPRVVVCHGREAGPAEHRRDVIQDRPEQGVCSVGVIPAVVVVEFGDEPQQLGLVESVRLGPGLDAGDDPRIDITSWPAWAGLPGTAGCTGSARNVGLANVGRGVESDELTGDGAEEQGPSPLGAC